MGVMYCDCNHYYTIKPDYCYRHQTQIEEESKLKLQKLEDYSQQLQASKVGGGSNVVSIYIQITIFAVWTGIWNWSS